MVEYIIYSLKYLSRKCACYCYIVNVIVIVNWWQCDHWTCQSSVQSTTLEKSWKTSLQLALTVERIVTEHTKWSLWQGKKLRNNTLAF